jgi:hypothetical protein
MSQYPLRLPDSLMEEAKKAAKADNTSLNQFLAVAVAEKVSALRTTQIIEERAQRSDPKAFQELLDRVPNTAPVPGDEITQEI